MTGEQNCNCYMINYETKLEENVVHAASKKQMPAQVKVYFLVLVKENRLDGLLRILLVHHSIREFQKKSGTIITNVCNFMCNIGVTSSTSFLVLLCYQFFIFLLLQQQKLVLMRVHPQTSFQFPSLNPLSQNVSNLFLSLLRFSVSNAWCGSSFQKISTCRVHH